MRQAEPGSTDRRLGQQLAAEHRPLSSISNALCSGFQHGLINSVVGPIVSPSSAKPTTTTYSHCRVPFISGVFKIIFISLELFSSDRRWRQFHSTLRHVLLFRAGHLHPWAAPYLLIPCLPWLLSSQLQPTPTPQETPTLALCLHPHLLQPSLCLHSSLHLMPVSFTAFRAPSNDLEIPATRS